MSERSGIEIDYCPQCRGVWLDRGELDKILERAEGSVSAPAPQPVQHNQPQHSQPQYSQPQYSQPQHNQPQYSQPQDSRQPYRKKKKEHWLSELFD